MKKLIIIIAMFLVIGSISGVLIYNKVIFQEGNPVPIVAGISKLSFTNRDIVKISDNPRWYIISSKDGYDPIINIMEGEDWEYIEQIGSGLIFEKGDERLTISTVQFTRWYRIVKFPSRERSTIVND